jgi:hypothetical protein
MARSVRDKNIIVNLRHQHYEMRKRYESEQEESQKWKILALQGIETIERILSKRQRGEYTTEDTFYADCEEAIRQHREMKLDSEWDLLDSTAMFIG